MTYRKKMSRHNLFTAEDDNEKEEYLEELGGAVHNYIRNGVKNRQLEELLEQEEEFQDRYRECFGISELIRAIEEDSRKKIEEDRRQGEEKELQQLRDNMESFLQSVFSSVEKTLESELNRIVRDAVYLSHANMLYELYEKEDSLRREEKKFREMSDRFRELADISERISRQRRMEVKELERESHISEQKLMHLLDHCHGLFNVRQKNNTFLVSLSPEGKRYSDFISNDKNSYSDEMLNQQTYKNCTSIIDSFRNSCHYKICHRPQLVGLRPDNERAIMHRYYQAMEEIPRLKKRDFLLIEEEDDRIMEEGPYSIMGHCRLVEERGGTHGRYKVKL